MNWPVSHAHKDLQKFLGSNFYHHFIQNYSLVAVPLTALTPQSIPFQWSQAAVRAFGKLRTNFTSAPILVFQYPTEQFIVEVDPSCFRDLLRTRRFAPVPFPMKTNPSWQNYDMGKWELIMVKLAWRQWLKGAGQQFLAWTDHKNLQYIRSAKRLSSWQARWTPFCNRFDFSLSYCPASKNMSDAFSCQFWAGSSSPSTETILPSSCDIGAVTWGIKYKVKRTHADTKKRFCWPFKLLCSVSPVGTFIPPDLPPLSSGLSFAAFLELQSACPPDFIPSLMYKLILVQATWLLICFSAPEDTRHSYFQNVKGEASVSSVQAFILHCWCTCRQAHYTILGSSDCYQQGANRHRLPAPHHAPGQSVWLFPRDLPLGVKSRNLAPRLIGPFPIFKVSLRLLWSMRIHPTFHVSWVNPVACCKWKPMLPCI